MVEEKTDCGQTNTPCPSTVPLELDTVLMSNECAAIFAVLRTKETLADSSVVKSKMLQPTAQAQAVQECQATVGLETKLQ